MNERTKSCLSNCRVPSFWFGLGAGFVELVAQSWKDVAVTRRTTGSPARIDPVGKRPLRFSSGSGRRCFSPRRRRPHRKAAEPYPEFKIFEPCGPSSNFFMTHPIRLHMFITSMHRLSPHARYICPVCAQNPTCCQHLHTKWSARSPRRLAWVQVFLALGQRTVFVSVLF